MDRDFFGLFVGAISFTIFIVVWLRTYRLFEEKYPPHDLRAGGPFKWQRRADIFAWIAATVIAFAVGLALTKISN
jgi:hypothetical protein